MIMFESILTTFLQAAFLEATGAIAKIGSSLKSNHNNQF
jgi:hypothetical protein